MDSGHFKQNLVGHDTEFRFYPGRNQWKVLKKRIT